MKIKMERNPASKIRMLIVSTIVLSLMILGINLTVPTFQTVFDGFGTQRPLSTAVVIESYQYWWALLTTPVALLGAIFVKNTFLDTTNTSNNLFALTSFTIAVNAITAILLLAFSIYAMSAPVFDTSF